MQMKIFFHLKLIDVETHLSSDIACLSVFIFFIYLYSFQVCLKCKMIFAV